MICNDLPGITDHFPDRHARLFELIRQQNLIACNRVGRKQGSLTAPDEAAFLALAEGSFLSLGGYL